MKEKPNRERKTPPKAINAIQLNEEQKLGSSYIYDNPITIITGRAGCLSKGTLVFMYDGTFKPVEEICVGDKLMGINSKPRNVLELKRGKEQMYWVRQKRGKDYRVNESHVLSLKRVESAIYSRKTENNKRIFDYDKPPIHIKKESTINISITEYLKLARKKQYKGYISPCIEFKERIIDIDPYYLGLWLGDGNKNCIREISTNDTEIINHLIDLGAKKSQSKYKWVLPPSLDMNNAVKKYFNVENVAKIKEKFVPEDYIFNSKENRLHLLAGILDSDGNYVTKGKYYDLTLKDRTLAQNIVLISRSLGYKTNFRNKIATMKRKDGSVYSCEVYRISITPTDIIPCKIERKKNKELSDFKNRSLTGISIEKDVVDNYYGFTLDGDNLFLLEDFTVTHNSGKSLCAAHCGLKFLSDKMASRITLFRPTVETGRSLGFLPGDMKAKLSEYFEAFIENLENCCTDKALIKKYLEDGKISENAIQFVRGKTFSDFVVIDEAQNCTQKEMEALITRLGKTGKIVVLGDLQQKDITNENDGLSWLINLSNHFEEIKRIDLKTNHRHPLVQQILDFTYGKK